jgi:flagellar biosynthetic protein FliO
MESATDLGFQLLKTAGGLALVIGILLASVYGLKRLGHWAKKPEANAWIQVLAQHSVGLKHHLLLVKIQGQMFLLGVSPQGMQFLAPVQANTSGPTSSENESK